MNQANLTSNGFQNQMLNDNVTSIRDGISGLSTQICGGVGDIQNSLCNGFAGVNATVSNGFANAETAANARQMANMNQAFGAQTAMMQGFNALGSQFADCCCENRLANCQTQNIIQNEGNATRFADAQNTRDIIQSQSNGTQAIRSMQRTTGSQNSRHSLTWLTLPHHRQRRMRLLLRALLTRLTSCIIAFLLAPCPQLPCTVGHLSSLVLRM